MPLCAGTPGRRGLPSRSWRSWHRAGYRPLRLRCEAQTICRDGASSITMGGRTGSGRYSGSGSATYEETAKPDCISAWRRRMSESLKPVAITVIFTASFTFSSSTAPKMMLASSCAALWMMRGGLVDLGQFERAGAGDVDENAARAVDRARFEQRRRNGRLRGLNGAVVRRWPWPCPSRHSPCPP